MRSLPFLHLSTSGLGTVGTIGVEQPTGNLSLAD